MPRLIIDDREIEVPEGTKVIEAAEKLGIMIPRFCFHEGLGSVGACRMCAVKFLQGPFKGVQMSCMVDAKDGMVVSTTDEEAVAFRKSVIEWLMLNHPHDCPVCDEGGQCLLQDETVSGGHGIRRYSGRKRTYRDQYLGPFIQHEMNRCIHCYRCARFYQEFSGYRDLGVMQIANRVYFGRHADGPLESPFSGNLVDICPTGVYTDKPARFKARRWDLQRASSFCIHCSLGCSTTANARYREMVRVEARFSEAVNGHFICDLGRFGFLYASHPGRPRRARIDCLEAPWGQAVRHAAERLAETVRSFGPESVACVGSARSSVETLCALKRFCKVQGWPEPVFFFNPAAERKAKAAVSRLDPGLAVSLRQVEKADFILAFGVDPINEAPMLALAMRQAHRKGAEVVVIDPRPVFLPFEFDHWPVAVGGMDRSLDAVVKGALSGDEIEKAESLSPEARSFYASIDSNTPGGAADRGPLPSIASMLGRSTSPVIVCGTGIVSDTAPGLAADHAALLSEIKGRCGLFYVLRGANAFGCALVSADSHRTFPDILDEIESGAVRALVLVESDPLYHYPDQHRVEQAFNKLDLLLVLDHLPSGSAQRAHAFIPTTAFFETGSTFINQEGRVQFAAPAHGGGLPIFQEACGAHPPRIYRGTPPGSDPRAAWEVLAELAQALSPPGIEISAESPSGLILEEIPALARLGDAIYPFDDLRVPHRTATAAYPSPGAAVSGKGAGAGEAEGTEGTQGTKGTAGTADDDWLDLLWVDWTFSSEELSAYSKVIHEAERGPCLFMHPVDAARAGLSDGDMVAVHLDRGSVQIKLSLSGNMAERTLVMPMHRRIAWQKNRSFSTKLPLDRIVKL